MLRRRSLRLLSLGTHLTIASLGVGCGGRSSLESPATDRPPEASGPPCGASVCSRPPPPACSLVGDRRTYGFPAHCDRGTCLYTATDTDCTWGCENGACKGSRFVYASAGGTHACAIAGDGRVKCWGGNQHGQLGNDQTIDSLLPVTAALDSTVIAVAAGAEHSCAIVANGSVWCWGANKDCQLGENSCADQHIPVAVDAGGMSSRATALSAGSTHTCAFVLVGAPVCWGLWDSWLVPGGGRSESASSYPAQTYFSPGAIAIAAGNLFTCAITGAHAVECFGWNPHGQLGTGSTANLFAPTLVGGLSGVRQLATGFAHTCTVTYAGGVKCWGANESGQLGVDTAGDSYLPEDVVGLASGAATVAAGTSSSCAVMQNGRVKCWGGNDLGQIGDGTTIPRKTPVDVGGLEGVLAVSVGDGFACAVLAQGHVKCWGRNDHGQLGDGSTRGRSRPADVLGL